MTQSNSSRPPSSGFAIPLDQAITSLRDHSVEELVARGLSVAGTFDEVDDPVLIGPDGLPVETWREGYPYDHRLTRDEYDTTKRLLQIELLKAQSWIKESGRRLVVLFEGHDAAGKGAASRDSWSTSIPGELELLHCLHLRPRSEANGIFNATCRPCRLQGRSSCSIDRGTTDRASSE